VANAGVVQVRGNPATCGAPDSVRVESSARGVQTPWSGDGTFDIADAAVQDQAGSASIDAGSSTDLGNNGRNWNITSTCNRASLTAPPAVASPAVATPPAVVAPDLKALPAVAGPGSAASTVVVAASPNPSAVGEPVTFTATVSAGPGPVAAGSVTFIEGGACSAPQTVLSGPIALNAGGQAIFRTSSLGAAGHIVTACYSGTARYDASNGIVEQIVGRSKQAPLVLDVKSPLVYPQTAAMSVTGGSAGGAVTYTLVSGPCRIEGHLLRPEGGMGICKVTATMAGNDDFSDVTSPERSVFLQRADQAAVTVTAPSMATYGTD
jgi:hypothetical protein